MSEFNLENKASSIIASHMTKVMEAQNKELNSLVAMFFQKNPEADPSLLKIIQQNKHEGIEFSLAYDFESHKANPVDVAAAREKLYREAYEDAVTDALNICRKFNDISLAEIESGIKALQPDPKIINALSPAAPTSKGGE